MTCVWLAAKVEEFNITIGQFVENLKQNSVDSTRSEDLILALELPVIHALKVSRIPILTLFDMLTFWTEKIEFFLLKKENFATVFLVSFDNSQSLPSTRGIHD